MEFEGTVYSNIHHLDQQLQQCYKDPQTVVEDMPDLLSQVFFCQNIATSFIQLSWSTVSMFVIYFDECLFS